MQGNIRVLDRGFCCVVAWDGVPCLRHGVWCCGVSCCGGHAVVCDVAGSLVVACPGSVCHVVLRCGASLWGAMMYVF